MKFKTIFGLFNAILIFSFAFIFLMPYMLLGGEYSLPFWSRNWPLFLLFLAILGGFNAFFIANWRLFSLLESEDWDALGALLDERVFKKKRYDRRSVRLFVNTSLLRGDMAGVERLETVLRNDKPAALRRDALLFGASRLLKNDVLASLAFLDDFKDGKGVENAEWLSFYHAFALTLAKRAPEACAGLEASMRGKDPVLVALSTYLLGTLGAATAAPEERERLSALAEAKRAELATRYGPRRWARETERAKSEIHIVILSKVLDEASSWLFKEPAARADGSSAP